MWPLGVSPKMTWHVACDTCHRFTIMKINEQNSIMIGKSSIGKRMSGIIRTYLQACSIGSSHLWTGQPFQSPHSVALQRRFVHPVFQTMSNLVAIPAINRNLFAIILVGKTIPEKHNWSLTVYSGCLDNVAIKFQCIEQILNHLLKVSTS